MRVQQGNYRQKKKVRSCLNGSERDHRISACFRKGDQKGEKICKGCTTISEEKERPSCALAPLIGPWATIPKQQGQRERSQVGDGNASA